MLERFREALGADAVRPLDGRSLRVPGPGPEVVVAPADGEQAVAAMRLCAENGWIVLPAGGRTWLHGGHVRSADVLLSTERLRGVVEYEPADLAVAVHAGTILSDLDGAVRAHNQFFPVQPPAVAGATVGGIIATGSAGPLRLGHGTPRDHVLGLQVVTGDGRRLDLGGRVVKNVAGYDLVRLMVGSRGSLGLITRAYLRLRPRPAHDITAVLRADSPDALDRAAISVMDTLPVAAELLHPGTAGKLLPGTGWALALRWHGNPSYAEHVHRRINAYITGHDVLEPAAARNFWTGLAELEADQAAAFILVSRPDALGSTLAAAGDFFGSDIERSDNTLRDAVGTAWQMAAHARSGIIRIWTRENELLERQTLLRRLVMVRQQLPGSTTVRSLVLPAGEPASTVEQHGAGVGHAPASAPDPEHERVRTLMGGVRHAFDPWGIMAPDPLAEPA